MKRPLLAPFFILTCAANAFTGVLVPTDSRFPPLEVRLHKVETVIDNQVAVTRVTQVFANASDARLEAIYVFPTPSEATIIDFAMTLNGRVMRGELLEKQRARETYERIVSRAKDPGLLEQIGKNVFRLRVFPVDPRSEQKIEITYVERIPYENGRCAWRYPLRVPGAESGAATGPMEIIVRILSQIPIREVASTAHRFEVTRASENEASAAFRAAGADPARDIELTYALAREKSGMDLIAHRAGGDGYFLLLLTPALDAGAEAMPKDMTFVFDTSGSMEGEKLRQAKAALRFCVAKLRAGDRFNIVRFSDTVNTFRPDHVSATDENRKEADRFVERLEALGGTDIQGALLRALAHKPEGGRPHMVLFLTDGLPTSGETDARAITRSVLAEGAGDARLFTFGVGSDVNRGLLEDLAERTRAVSSFVAPAEDIEVAVSALQRRIVAPVISGVEIDWGGADVQQVYPQRIPDVYAGVQLLIAGRYGKPGAHRLTLRGRHAGRDVAVQQEVTLPEIRPASEAIKYVWGSRRIADLLDRIRLHGENPEIVSDVTRLSREYRVATPYTSFLVLESEAAYDREGIERRGASFRPPELAGTPPREAAVGRRGTPRDAPATPSDNDEPTIFLPEARASDHNESADGEDYHQMKGDSRDFQSSVPGAAGGVRGRQAGANPGAYDTMGVGAGGGAGGLHGGRFGGRENLVRAQGGSATRIFSAVHYDLRWLARHQNSDGSWSARGFERNCGRYGFSGTCAPNRFEGNAGFDVGVTGLALLAYLGAGYTPSSHEKVFPGVPDSPTYGQVVRHGIKYLLSIQNAEGLLSGPSDKRMYNHAVAALVLCEAYGMTALPELKDPAQRAVDYLIRAKTPGGGWRYAPGCGDTDSSVTGWAIMVLKSAELADLRFDKGAYQDVRKHYDDVTNQVRPDRLASKPRGSGTLTKDLTVTGYKSRDDAGQLVVVPGVNDPYEYNPSMTAMMVMSSMFMDRKLPDKAGGAIDTLLAYRPQRWSPDDPDSWKVCDFYYWYCASYAMHQVTRDADPRWKSWNQAMRAALVETQNVPPKYAKQCKEGSWDPVDRWSCEGGRVYATAMGALTVEVYFRYPRAILREDRAGENK